MIYFDFAGKRYGICIRQRKCSPAELRDEFEYTPRRNQSGVRHVSQVIITIGDKSGPGAVLAKGHSICSPLDNASKADGRTRAFMRCLANIHKAYITVGSKDKFISRGVPVPCRVPLFANRDADGNSTHDLRDFTKAAMLAYMNKCSFVLTSKNGPCDLRIGPMHDAAACNLKPEPPDIRNTDVTEQAELIMEN